MKKILNKIFGKTDEHRDEDLDIKVRIPKSVPVLDPESIQKISQNFEAEIRNALDEYMKTDFHKWVDWTREKGPDGFYHFELIWARAVHDGDEFKSLLSDAIRDYYLGKLEYINRTSMRNLKLHEEFMYPQLKTLKELLVNYCVTDETVFALIDKNQAKLKMYSIRFCERALKNDPGRDTKKIIVTLLKLRSDMPEYKGQINSILEAGKKVWFDWMMDKYESCNYDANYDAVPELVKWCCKGHPERKKALKDAEMNWYHFKIENKFEEELNRRLSCGPVIISDEKIKEIIKFETRLEATPELIAEKRIVADDLIVRVIARRICNDDLKSMKTFKSYLSSSLTTSNYSFDASSVPYETVVELIRAYKTSFVEAFISDSVFHKYTKVNTLIKLSWLICQYLEKIGVSKTEFISCLNTALETITLKFLQKVKDGDDLSNIREKLFALKTLNPDYFTAKP